MRRRPSLGLPTGTIQAKSLSPLLLAGTFSNHGQDQEREAIVAPTQSTITMSGPITEIANFLSSSGVSVTVTSSPAVGPGFIKVDDVVQSTPYTTSWTAGSTHKLEATTPVSCGARCQYVFVQWSDGTTTPVYESYVIPSTGPASITAIYETQYQIIIGAQSVSVPMLVPPTLLTNVAASPNSCLLLAEKKKSCIH